MLSPDEIIAAIKTRYPNIHCETDDGRINITCSGLTEQLVEIWRLNLDAKEVLIFRVAS